MKAETLRKWIRRAEVDQGSRPGVSTAEAQLPNELWQADITAWKLASGEVVEILNLIDDHSRLHLV